MRLILDQWVDKGHILCTGFSADRKEQRLRGVQFHLIILQR